MKKINYYAMTMFFLYFRTQQVDDTLYRRNHRIVP